MKIRIILLAFCLALSCDKTETNPNCNFLLNVGINQVVNLNLPQFNQLQFPVNTMRLEGQGNQDLILVRLNSATLLAWDGADPNHALTSCSRLEISGLIATCSCGDGNTYNLTSGLLTSSTPQPCTLKAYRVEDIGNNSFLISN